MNDRFSADELPRMQQSGPPRSPWPIDLAHIRPFELGGVQIQPASREVLADGRREALEPLVMQVLVALASARGETLSRDDLIAACWGGRAVTDDAINRVMSRLRALSRDFGGFEVETIVKVGYRLVEPGDDPSYPSQIAKAGARKARRPGIDRRTLVTGAAATAAVVAGVIAWKQPWRHHPPSEAIELFRRGDLAQRVGTPEQSRQSASYFERAVRIDPLYAEAWGALALAYTHNLDGLAEAELASMPGRIRSAARRAFNLDPDNADAQLGLISIPPTFRNWTQSELNLRRFCERFSQHWLGLGRLAQLLYQVGRLEDGIAFHRRVIAIDPMIAGPYAFAAAAMSSAGQIQEADAMLRQAHERWPAHPLLWLTKYHHLLFSGRPQSAAAFVMDPDGLPSGFGPAQVEPRLRLARAVDTRVPADVEISFEDYRRMALADVAAIPIAAAAFSLLERPDLTFASLDRYYLNRGAFGPPVPIGPYTRRFTGMLFSPPMMTLRSDPRFGSLLGEIGLEAYWRETETVPDYRRVA